MSIYRYKGSKVWTVDFMFPAQRIRESTGTRSKTLAKKIEDRRRRALEEGAAGIKETATATFALCRISGMAGLEEGYTFSTFLPDRKS